MFIIRVNRKEYKTIKQVCEHYGINYRSVMNKRSKENLTVESALSHFINKGRNKKVNISCWDSEPRLRYVGYEDLYIASSGSEPEKKSSPIISDLLNLFNSIKGVFTK